MKKGDKIPKYDPEFVRDVSEAVYRQRLEKDCPGGVQRMLVEDGDGGKKLRTRAASYDSLTRAYFDIMADLPKPCKI